MPRLNDEWKVLPHGPLALIDDGIWTVVGEIPMPLMDLPRRMTVVRLSGGRLLVWSAMALDDATMAKLDALGTPAFLVVPNDHHRLDAKVWKDRYPQVQVVAPEGSRDKIADAVPVDTTKPDFDDPDVQFVIVPGTRGHEAALIVRRPGATTLVLNDIVGNIQHEHGFGGWLLRVAGFAGDKAQIPTPVRMLLVKDTDALRAQLLAWAELDGLQRIIVSHGSPIERNAQGTLRTLAESLA